MRENLETKEENCSKEETKQEIKQKNTKPQSIRELKDLSYKYLIP
jgi:hypothetical protein